MFPLSTFHLAWEFSYNKTLNELKTKSASRRVSGSQTGVYLSQELLSVSFGNENTVWWGGGELPWERRPPSPSRYPETPLELVNVCDGKIGPPALVDVRFR